MPTTKTIDIPRPGRVWVRNDDGSGLAIRDSGAPLTITAAGVPALPFFGWLLPGSSEQVLEVSPKPGQTTIQASSLLLSGDPYMTWGKPSTAAAGEPPALWAFGKTTANTVLDIPLDGVLGRVTNHVQGTPIGRVSLHQFGGESLFVSRDGTAPTIAPPVRPVEYWGEPFTVRYSVAGVPTLRVISDSVATVAIKAV